MTGFKLNHSQIEYLNSVLLDERIQDIMEANSWYAQFIPSIRLDITRRAYITERQLYQIEKLARILNIQWRIVIA